LSGNRREVRRVAFGGIVSALSLVCMFLSGIFPFAEYTCPALAGMLLTVLVMEFGQGTAWTAYGAVALLSLLLVPNRESSLLFCFFFGHYPILKALLERIPLRAAEWAVKIAVFNVCVLAAYGLMVYGLGMSAVLKDAAIGGLSLRASLILLLAAGNGVFVLYDVTLTRLIVMYCINLRPRLRRYFK